MARSSLLVGIMLHGMYGWASTVLPAINPDVAATTLPTDAFFLHVEEGPACVLSASALDEHIWAIGGSAQFGAYITRIAEVISAASSQSSSTRARVAGTPRSPSSVWTAPSGTWGSLCAPSTA